MIRFSYLLWTTPGEAPDSASFIHATVCHLTSCDPVSSSILLRYVKRMESLDDMTYDRLPEGIVLSGVASYDDLFPTKKDEAQELR